jgi:hypothetical protein
MTEYQPTPYFLHRHPTRDLFESVCLRCFLTIASSKNVSLFLTEELEHVCDESLIAQHAGFKQQRAN